MGFKWHVILGLFDPWHVFPLVPSAVRVSRGSQHHKAHFRIASDVYVTMCFCFDSCMVSSLTWLCMITHTCFLFVLSCVQAKLLSPVFCASGYWSACCPCWLFRICLCFWVLHWALFLSWFMLFIYQPAFLRLSPRFCLLWWICWILQVQINVFTNPT